MVLYFQQREREHREDCQDWLNTEHLKKILSKNWRPASLKACFLFAWLSAKNYLIDSENQSACGRRFLSNPVAPIIDLFCFCVGGAELKALQYIPEICSFIACRATGSEQPDNKIEAD